MFDAHARSFTRSCWRVSCRAGTGQQVKGNAAMPELIHVASPDRFPLRLAELGSRVTFLDGVEGILPPLSDVPPCPFLMGSDPNKEKHAYIDDQPQHWVTLGVYQIVKHPVTVVNNVSWHD